MAESQEYDSPKVEDNLTIPNSEAPSTEPDELDLTKNMDEEDAEEELSSVAQGISLLVNQEAGEAEPGTGEITLDLGTDEDYDQDYDQDNSEESGSGLDVQLEEPEPDMDNEEIGLDSDMDTEMSDIEMEGEEPFQESSEEDVALAEAEELVSHIGFGDIIAHKAKKLKESIKQGWKGFKEFITDKEKRQQFWKELGPRMKQFGKFAIERFKKNIREMAPSNFDSVTEWAAYVLGFGTSFVGNIEINSHALPFVGNSIGYAVSKGAKELILSNPRLMLRSIKTNIVRTKLEIASENADKYYYDISDPEAQLSQEKKDELREKISIISEDLKTKIEADKKNYVESFANDDSFLQTARRGFGRGIMPGYYAATLTDVLGYSDEISDGIKDFISPNNASEASARSFGSGSVQDVNRNASSGTNLSERDINLSEANPVDTTNTVGNIDYNLDGDDKVFAKQTRQLRPDTTASSVVDSQAPVAPVGEEYSQYGEDLAAISKQLGTENVTEAASDAVRQMTIDSNPYMTIYNELANNFRSRNGISNTLKHVWQALNPDVDPTRIGFDQLVNMPSTEKIMEMATDIQAVIDKLNAGTTMEDLTEFEQVLASGFRGVGTGTEEGMDIGRALVEHYGLNQ